MRGTGSACVAAAVLAACLPVVVSVAGRCGAGVLVLALLAVLAVGLLCCLAVGLASDLGFDPWEDVSVSAGFDLTDTDARVLVCLCVCVSSASGSTLGGGHIRMWTLMDRCVARGCVVLPLLRLLRVCVILMSVAQAI